MRTRVFTAGFAVLALAVLTPASAGQRLWAQGRGAATTTAVLTGVVTGDRGAGVAGATVSLTSQAGGSVLGPVKTDGRGEYRFAAVAPGLWELKVAMAGFRTHLVEVRLDAGATRTVNVALVRGRAEDVISVTAASEAVSRDAQAAGRLASPPMPPAAMAAGGRGGGGASAQQRYAPDWVDYRPHYPVSGETYAEFTPNRFHSTSDRPLSTFGADVDTASYTNIRRFLSQGQLPPREAIRIEEMLNYFHPAFDAPRGGHPISITTEIGDAPWAPGHKLVLIGARAAAPTARVIEGRNIVLLLDVSGSMAPAERLPMLKTAMALFADTLQPDDVLSIVTYAGTSGVALRPTPVRQRHQIQSAIAGLQAGGSTNGGQGLRLAYQLARERFIPGGVNRVILATDGDFNVGITSETELLQLIERERRSGVFLSVLGVGSGNLKDRTMEMLADKGNGHYAYLDTLQEARRVLIREADSTLETVAKDVKFQVEFNPAVVSAWKLIGYETRALAARDFNDDRKDAGEMGSGHTVTVLYEVVPVGVDRARDLDDDRPAVDPLRYQPRPAPVEVPRRQSPAPNAEWLTVKTRYKLPDEETSRLMTHPVRAGARLVHLPLASAVAEFGLILRDAPRDQDRWQALTARVSRLDAPAPLASDVQGFREMVETARGLSRLRR